MQRGPRQQPEQRGSFLHGEVLRPIRAGQVHTCDDRGLGPMRSLGNTRHTWSHVREWLPSSPPPAWKYAPRDVELEEKAFKVCNEQHVDRAHRRSFGIIRGTTVGCDLPQGDLLAVKAR